MDTETEILYAEDTQIEEEILREAWPIPPEDKTRAFEDYLEEIGLRFG